MAKEKITGRTRESVSYDEVIAAIKDSNGIKATICKRLDINRDDLDYFVRKHPTVARAIEWEKENAVDAAIEKLIERIKAGSGDQKAIEFFLRAQAKDKGYGESSDVNVKGRIQHELDWSQATKVLQKMKEHQALKKPKKALKGVVEGEVVE